MKNQLNELQKIMQKKMLQANNAPSIVKLSSATAAASWLRKNKQTNNGKNFEPVTN